MCNSESVFVFASSLVELVERIFTALYCPLQIIPQHNKQRSICSSIQDFVLTEISIVLSPFVVLVAVVVLKTFTSGIGIVC